jgi:hypothetical protein
VDLALQLPVELTSYSMDVRVPHPVGPTGSSPHSHPTPVELTSYSMDVRVPHPVGPTGSSPHSHPTPVELTSYSMDVRVPHPVGPTGREYCHAAVRPIPKRLTARADSPCTPRKCGRFSSYKGFILCLPRPIRTTQITASL